jgi:hypothetical protein
MYQHRTIRQATTGLNFDAPAGGIDAVIVTLRTSTWAMLLLGFAAIGFMAYRRKSKPASTAA